LATFGGPLLFAGCLGSPSAVDAPDFDAESAAEEALALYDADGNGSLDESELAKSAALARLLEAVDIMGQPVDKNRDQALDAAEIAARVEIYVENGTGRSMKSALVTRNGSPVADAEVTFEPEPFMSDVIEPAYGVTDAQGNAFMSIKDADPPGVTFGFFRIRVSKKDSSGQETLPAKFNTNTTLGAEIAPMTERGQGDLVLVELED